MGSGEEVRPHVMKNEQSDRTGEPRWGCRVQNLAGGGAH